MELILSLISLAGALVALACCIRIVMIIFSGDVTRGVLLLCGFIPGPAFFIKYWYYFKKPVLTGVLAFLCAVGAYAIDDLGTEPWMKRSAREWPQLVLTNEASFTAHTPLSGASAFLIEDKRVGVAAVTAMHLLSPNGGVRPEIKPDQLDSVLLNWRLYPMNKPDRSIEVSGVEASRSSKEYFDWLVLRLKPSAPPLPATPLHIRSAPVQVGERVYLVGITKGPKGLRQRAYWGRVEERQFGDRFRFSLFDAVDITGLSGAPIVDSKGRLVGIMSLLFEPRTDGKRMVEAGGEDAASLLEALRTSQKADAI